MSGRRPGRMAWWSREGHIKKAVAPVHICSLINKTIACDWRETIVVHPQRSRHLSIVCKPMPLSLTNQNGEILSPDYKQIKRVGGEGGWVGRVGRVGHTSKNKNEQTNGAYVSISSLRLRHTLIAVCRTMEPRVRRLTTIPSISGPPIGDLEPNVRY